jgi:hypothetical protein
MDYMATNKDFIIDQVSWHTKISGNPESVSHVEARFRVLFSFLKTNNLLTSSAPISLPAGSLDGSFCLQSSHLTGVGLRVMKGAYERWLNALDRGTSPEKTTILERELEKVLREAERGRAQ